MLAKLVLHNEISRDGAIPAFEASLELRYRLVRGYAPGLMLVGAVPAKTGSETFAGPVPEEMTPTVGALMTLTTPDRTG